MRNFVRAIVLIVMSGYATISLAQMQRVQQPVQDDGGSRITPRVERLEEQLVDLQGVVAAVETLAKNGSGGAASYPTGGGSGGNSEQLRQLSEQIADLTQRMERLEARFGGTAPAPQARPEANLAKPSSGGFDEREQLSPLTSQQSQPDRYAAVRPSQPPSSTYNSVASEPRPSPRTSNVEQAAVGAGVSSGLSSGAARSLYDQAYSAFNRREYSAAATYFEQFLQQYPADPMAGTAQFWLAESAFVSGEYRSAADRFLKAFTNYPSNEKAPEALLKLAISLRRLGENNAACESFSELQKRFPQLSQSIAKRAEAEKRRANCT